ncbi:MAG TPA: hypothetical protein VMG12_22850 [Polyangiaceae bacterium]|nr:hypothetical protein [Polyangiaceae bacterium]
MPSDNLLRLPGARLRLAALALSFIGSISSSALAQEAPASPAPESKPQDPVLVCLGNHTEGQQSRRDGKLLESRTAFRACSATTCPSEIIRDCFGWLEEVEKQIPSMSVTVTADGVSRNDAQVYVDDVLVLEKLSGRAVDVDPGQHRLRVVLPPFEPFEEQVFFPEGDRFRVVDVKFSSPRPATVAGPTTPSTTPTDIEPYRPVPIASYVFGGIGIAAAISGSAWGISNMALRSDMEDQCSPNCSDKSIDVLKQRALIADISWGVSIVSIATAATIYFLRPEESLEQPVAVDLRLLPAGALGTFSVKTF